MHGGESVRERVGGSECMRERERVLISYTEYFVFLHSWSWTVTE